MTAPLQGGMADTQDQPREHRDVVTQRVRVGITGLAAVFLLTLLAASIFSFLGQDDRTIKLANGAMVVNTQAPSEPPREPLAELGVAPGASTPKPVPQQMTGNPPMLTLSPPAPVLSNQSNTAAPAQR